MSPTDRVEQLKQVYLTIEKLQNKLEALQQAQTEPIAIIGMSCRYPNGANSPEAFWELLRDGRDGITDVPPGRWEAAAYYDPQADRPGKIATRWGGFLDNVASFDARFFGIAPREAAQMDPQQRLLLEVAWEALEAAGQPAGTLAGSATGVYVGLLNSEYGWLQSRDVANLDAYSGTGTSLSVASGRLAYVLGLQGPSITLDTACSSSLVAIHLACQALRNGECSLALAGGVSVVLSPLALMPFSRMGLLAADGRCKTLDASADGFGSGEGCALLVLKRLSEAQADGDPILALVRGSAVNQDGRTNVLSAPNGRAQEAVIRQALENARLTPGDLSLIELHGTGTALGDPIETDALRAVFGRTGEPDGQAAAARPVYLGAVKSNIGHTGAAAGAAGVIKTILALQHDTIPPNLHFQHINPHINLSNTAFAIPTEPRPWPKSESPRFAGISAFGWSGTNAHLILSDPPPPVGASRRERQIEPVPAHVLALSGRSEAAVRELAAGYRDHLRSPGGQQQTLADIAYTAAVRRTHQSYRLAAVGTSHSQVADRLQAYLEQSDAAGIVAGHHAGTRRRKLVFVFSPHGSQWLGMGRALWQQSPVFRAALATCQAALQPFVDWRLEEKLAAEDGRWLEDISILQPVLFALQVGLAAVWRAWGVVPDAIVGHSMGELAAAHVAGILTLDDAARIICRRTQLLRGLSGAGTMGVVELSAEQAQAAIALFGGRLTIAANNSPRSTVLAGEPAAMEALFEQLQARGIYCGWGVADVASHGPRMAGLTAELRQAIGSVERRPATIAIFSTVTGDWDDGRQFDTEYWVRHLNQPVRFAEAVRKLAESGHDLFMEIGPGPVLGPAIEEGLQHDGLEGLTLAALRREAGSYADLLESLGRLYAAGYAVPWRRLYPAGTVVPGPAYPWQRERFWLSTDIDTLVSGRARVSRAGAPAPAILGERREVAGEPGKVVWDNVYDRRYFPHLFQHRLFGRAILPASAYIEIGLALAPGHGEVELRDLRFSRAFSLAEEAPWTDSQLVLDQEPDGSTAFCLYSHSDDQWLPHGAGQYGGMAIQAEEVDGDGPRELSPAPVRESLPDHLDGPAFYARWETLGVEYGPELQGITEIAWRRTEAVAQVRLPERFGRELAAGAMPTVAIDTALQTLAWLVVPIASDKGAIYAPAAIRHVNWHSSGKAPAWAQAQLGETDGQTIRGDATLYDEDGTALLDLAGVRFDAVSGAAQAKVSDWLYEVAWEPVEAPADPAVLTGRWLIFADELGIGEGVAAAIDQGGGQAQMVRPAAEFAQLPTGEWQLRPDRPADYLALCQGVALEGLAGIIHLWSVSDTVLDVHPADDLDQRLTRRPAAILHLIQAIKQAAPEATVPVWLVTAGAQPAAGARVVPEQATVWGLGYVLAEEHHELWGGLIDFDPDAEPAATAAHLFRYLATGQVGDRMAFRGEQWLAARLARCQPNHPLDNAQAGRPAGPTRALFRPDAAYLITGGFGDIALTVAQWAVERGARRLILLGRTALPPRNQWRALEPDSPTGRRARAVQALEALGAAVQWGAVDVGDAETLADYLDHYAAEGWPAIRGVIHGAAIIEDRLIVDLDRESLERVAHPKAAGAWHLHRYFSDKPLDFFVLFSSSGALMGAAGQANYAAANAGLDAVAHVRRAAGLPATSINWGFWDNLGFANTPGGQRAVAYMNTFGMAPLAAPEALQALAYVLARPDLTQVAAMKVDWQRWRAHSRLVGVPPFLRRMEQAEANAPANMEAAPGVREQLLELEPGPLRLRKLQAYILGQLASVLHLDPATIDLETPLGSLGIDSLTAIELRNRFERGLGLQLSATLVWNYPTIAAMAPHLAEKMGLALTPPAAPAPTVPVAAEDELAAFLSEAEGLSEADLRQLLQEGLADE